MDLEEFKYGGTNITALRLVDPEGPEVKKAVKDWNKKGDVVLVSLTKETCSNNLRVNFLLASRIIVRL